MFVTGRQTIRDVIREEVRADPRFPRMHHTNLAEVLWPVLVKKYSSTHFQWGYFSRIVKETCESETIS